MADIFGKTSYPQYRDLESQGFSADTYVEDNWETIPSTAGKRHNFGSLETRAVQGSTPLGFLVDNMTAVQAVVEEVLRAPISVERFMPIKTDIDPGPGKYSYQVMDRTGQAEFIDDAGTNAPSVKASAVNQDFPLRFGGIMAEYTDDALRGAMFAGIPLDSRLIEDAVNAAVEKMEDVAIRGDGDVRGLINQATRTASSTTNLDRVVVSSASGQLNAGAVAAATTISDAIGALVERSRDVVGRVLGGTVVVALPAAQYNVVMSTTMDNKGSDLSIAEHVMRHNGFVDDAAGNSVRFERLAELDGAGASNADRMVVLLNHERVLEFAAPILPRAGEVIRLPYGVQVPIEFKIGRGPSIKRPIAITYVDGV